MKELGWVEMEREEQEARPDRKVYSITEQGHVALRQWQAQPPGIFQLRDELLLKVLFGTFAALDDIAQHLRASIATHEMSLLAYHQNAHHIPAQGTYPQGNRRPNPYAAERDVGVDHMPLLCLRTWSGIVVLERSLVVKSCLRQDETSFAEGAKNAHATSCLRGAHISNVSFRRANKGSSQQASGESVTPCFPSKLSRVRVPSPAPQSIPFRSASRSACFLAHVKP